MTDTVVDRPVDSKPEREKPARESRGQWRPLLVRMHFYAGILAAPFIFIACATGLIFVFAPQIDRITDANLLVVEQVGTVKVPLNQQVANAAAAVPGLNLTSVQPNTRPDETTRVNFIRPGAPPMTNHTVYVNPYSGKVQGHKDVSMHGGYMGFTAWAVGFHGDMDLGEVGRWYSELASLWIVVATLGGIIVWWQRAAVRRSITSGAFWKKFLIVERGKRPGVKRTMSWHSTIGVWTAVIALLFGLTGLPFARTSGPKWLGLTGATNMHLGTAKLDTTMPKAAGTPAAGAPATCPAGSHPMPDGSCMSNTDGSMTSAAGGSHSSGQATGTGQATGSAQGGAPAQSGASGHGGMTMNKGFPSSAKADFDLMAKNVAAVGVTQQIRFTAPTRPGGGWTVSEGKSTWPVAADSALVDPTTFSVIRAFDWNKQATTNDKLNKWILLFHFGQLFGFTGRVIFGLTMLAVMWIIWWGYKMWWQRRPRGSALKFGKMPTRGSWRKAPKVSLAIWTAVTLALFWVFPVLAVSTAIFLVLDVAIGLIGSLRKTPAAATS